MILLKMAGWQRFWFPLPYIHFFRQYLLGGACILRIVHICALRRCAVYWLSLVAVSSKLVDVADVVFIAVWLEYVMVVVDVLGTCCGHRHDRGIQLATPPLLDETRHGRALGVRPSRLPVWGARWKQRAWCLATTATCHRPVASVHS